MSTINYMTRPIRQSGRIRDIKDWYTGKKKFKLYEGGLARRFSLYGSNRSYQIRLKLCDKLEEWLLALSKIKVPMGILIGGAFVTKDPEPAHVEVVCIIGGRLVLRPAQKDLMRELLTDKKNVEDRYCCSIVDILARKNGEDDAALYNKALDWFKFDKKYEPTIYRVNLQEAVS
jgi:hypothetical protein